MMLRVCLAIMLGLSTFKPVQSAERLAGPMVGYSAMREAQIWVQTDQAAQIAIRYWPTGSPELTKQSPTIDTNPRAANTAHVTISGLEPGQRYNYSLLIDDNDALVDWPLRFQTQTLWQWRQDPPDFSFALGSCAYINEAAYDRPGKPYGAHYEIFGQIHKTRPDFMLWLGDNTYLREADWDSRSGILHRFSHSRALDELQPLLGSTHHYAIWDDHDYGPNNADRSYVHKQVTLDAFKSFWANPGYDATGHGGITGSFEWADAQFFLLDDRWFRSANNRRTGTQQIYGEQQIDWLLNALKASQATFKFIATGSVFVYNGRHHDSAINVAPIERERLLSAIESEGITGVVFLSGDVHHSQLVRLDRHHAYPIFEWTVSPLTAGTYPPYLDSGTNIVEGSVVVDRNFGIVEITGPKDDRIARLRVIDYRGDERWRFELRATELCQPLRCP